MPPYRTDLQGTITLVITPEGDISFTTQTSVYNEYLMKSAYELEELNLKDEIKNYKKTL